MSKFEELTKIEADAVWKNQTNLKRAFKALPEMQRMIREGEKNEEITNIFKELTQVLQHLLEYDIREAFIFMQIEVYGNSAPDIYIAYGENLKIDNSKELRDITSATLN